MTTVNEFFDKINAAATANPAVATEADAIFQFNITGAEEGVYVLDLSAGKTADFHIYPGAPHGFHADFRSSYRKEAAEDGWARALAWFRKYGVL